MRNLIYPPRLADLNEITQATSLADLRQRLLNQALIGASLLGLGVYILNLVQVLQNNQPPVNLLLYSLLYADLLILTFARNNLRYGVRATGLVLTPYLAGLFALLASAYSGDGRIWMVGFVTLAGIFFGFRAGIGAWVMSGITLLGSGWLMSQGYLAGPALPQYGIPTDFNMWLATTATYLLITLILGAAQAALLNGLERSLNQQAALATNFQNQSLELARSSQDLSKRLLQLHTAGEIARIISTTLQVDQLLDQVVELVRERFDLYYVGIFLVDERNEFAVLNAATGQAGKDMLAEGHRLSIGGTSMIGWSIAHRKPRIALDTGQEAVRFNNPYLPRTRSELALPIMLGKQVLGAMTVQSDLPNAFDENDITVLQSISDSLGSALQNSRLFQELQSSLDEINTLNRDYLQGAWNEKLAAGGVLEYTYENRAIQSTSKHLRSERIPLKVRDQEIGAIIIESDQSAWTAEDRAFIDAVSTQASLALENARLLEETQKQAVQERLVADVSGKIWSAPDMENILRTTIAELADKLQVAEGLITLEVDRA